jgi:hypothetical protein
MPSDDQDKSIFDAVARRRRRSSELQRLAKERGLLDSNEQTDEPLRGLAGDSELSTQEQEMNQLESAHEPVAPERSIDEQLLAKMGTGTNDYGVAEDLFPQIDFDVIPLTQPKRVLAKTRSGQLPEKGAVEDDSRSTEETTSRAPKRKKKTPSLLDSYFKGL